MKQHAYLDSIRREWTVFLAAAQQRRASVEEILEFADSKGADVVVTDSERDGHGYKELAFRDPRIVRFAPWSSSDTVISVYVDSDGKLSSYVVQQRPTSL